MLSGSEMESDVTPSPRKPRCRLLFCFCDITLYEVSMKSGATLRWKLRASGCTGVVLVCEAVVLLLTCDLTNLTQYPCPLSVVQLTAALVST